MALSALREVRRHKEFFEINTEAISRGYASRPYPAPFLLDKMKKLDCKLVLTSDCHDANYLDVTLRKQRNTYPDTDSTPYII